METLAKYNVEGRPIWKPMHMQSISRINPFVTKNGNGMANTNAYIATADNTAVVEDILIAAFVFPVTTK